MLRCLCISGKKLSANEILFPIIVGGYSKRIANGEPPGIPWETLY